MGIVFGNHLLFHGTMINVMVKWSCALSVGSQEMNIGLD